MQDQRQLDLRERIAVVTGASGGFGAESARALADAGAKVVFVGRDEARLRPLAEELGDRAAVVEAVVAELAGQDRDWPSMDLRLRHELARGGFDV